MKMKKLLPLVSFIIAVFLFMSIYLIGSVLNAGREQYIEEQFQSMYNDFNEMQTFFLMSEAYGDEMACLAFESRLKTLDKTIWTMGEKLDKYRSATEEFHKSSYYLEQKKIFNENEVFYFLLLKKMIDMCEMDKEIILFFYQNSADCRKCDDQSFILTDIKEEDYGRGREEIAIFSFDTDLNITTIDLLAKYYRISEYPCIVIGNGIYCGIRDKDFIVQKICRDKPELYFCSMNNGTVAWQDGLLEHPAQESSS